MITLEQLKNDLPESITGDTRVLVEMSIDIAYKVGEIEARQDALKSLEKQHEYIHTN